MMIDVRDTARLFVAIDMPPTIQHTIVCVQRELKEQGLIVKGTYIPSTQTHVTLAFLGSVPRAHEPLIIQSLETIKMSPFSVQTGDIDVFMHRSSVRIIFLNLVSSMLAQLAAQVVSALDKWLICSEQHFVPHVTIARVKKVDDSQRLLDSIEQIQVEPITCMINSFVLKESVLTPQGPHYSTKAHFILSLS